MRPIVIALVLALSACSTHGDAADSGDASVDAPVYPNADADAASGWIVLVITVS